MKIGIVEDEFFIANSIVKLLQEMNYAVTKPAVSYEEAVEMLRGEKPDLVLVDIQLRGKKDGIELARYINEHYSVPFIFLTANSDSAIVEKAKKVRPSAFLVKPFTREDLYTSVEICLSNFQRTEPASSQKLSLGDVLFIKEGNAYHKIRLKDILYLESDHVYVNIVTTDRTYLVRASLQEYGSKLDATQFVRVHRSYVVNFDRVEKIEAEGIVVAGKPVPMSKAHREVLLQQLNLK